MDTNPLETLGFNSQALKDLTESEICVLAKQLHRGWMMIRHPDRGGTQAQSAQLNAAMEEIEKPETLGFWLTDLQKSPRKKANEKLARAEAKTSALNQVIEAYIATLANVQTPCVLPKGRLLVFDMLRMSSLVDMIGSSGSNTNPYARGTNFTPGSFYELEISEEGNLKRFILTQANSNDAGKRWFIGGHRIPLRRTGESNSLPYRLVGAISNTSLNMAKGKVQGFRSLLPSAQYVKGAKITDPENGYSFEEFEPYMEYLSPATGRDYEILVGYGNKKFYIAGRRSPGELK